MELGYDPGAVIEVVPKQPGVKQFQLVFLIAGQFAQALIVEQQSPIFVDHAQAGRTELQGFAKLTLVLGRFGSENVAVITGRRRPSCYVGRH